MIQFLSEPSKEVKYSSDELTGKESYYKRLMILSWEGTER